MSSLIFCKNLNVLKKNPNHYAKILIKNHQYLNSLILNQFKSTSSNVPLDLTFTDAKEAYKSKKTIQLFRSLFVLKISSYSFIVNNNDKLIKLGNKILGKTLFTWLIKNTFYAQFVAGENEENIKPVIENMKAYGVKSILDYSAEEDISDEQIKKADNQQNVEHIVNIPLNKADENKFKQFKPQKDFTDLTRYKPLVRTYFYLNEAQCEKNVDIFLKCIDSVAGSTGNTGLAAVKLTALGRPQLLLQLSEVIERTRTFFTEVTGKKDMAFSNVSVREFQDNLDKRFHIKTDDPEIKKWLEKMDHDKKGLMNLFSWNGLVDMKEMLNDVFRVLNIKTGKVEKVISCLTLEEQEMFKNMMRRVHQISKHAQESDVRVMIDAEQSYFQPAISRITMELMRKYNKEKPIIFNTYQCYLKKAYENIIIDLELAKRQNFYFGAKLVRGAYMKQERARAKKGNYEDPINPTFEATNKMYFKCLTEVMNRMKENKLDNKLRIMVATHNEDTVRFTVEKMKEFGIDPEHKLICFGQLFGMCDHISYLLGQSGYSVYKYLPYGPVNEVIAYLSRRAIENHDVLQKVDKEKKMITQEILRRLFQGNIFYKPPTSSYTPI